MAKNNLQKKAGRPEVAPEHRKKNRAISLTDAEYSRLEGDATAAGYKGVSKYVVEKLGLGKPKRKAKTTPPA